MADATDSSKPVKNAHAEREEAILAGWKAQGIFEKTLAKHAPKGEFVFYEGPPGANGLPHIGHFETRAFKDAIPRYRTMQGYHVRRKSGWDTHGLPVELQVEKELGLKSKKDIEIYGVEKFNEKCKEAVWKYVNEWAGVTDRMGYWVDLEHPYVTYKPDYIESVWNVIKEADKKKLLYKDYKVVPWCPRCGTGLSSHELAQGYETVKDLTATVKFELVDHPGTYFLAWTTTPWTLPGNVALAVGPQIEYSKVKTEQGIFILASARMASVLKDMPFEVLGTMKGSEFAGGSYKPLYPFLKDHVSGHEKDKLVNAFKVYTADFVTTEDGTGIVHIAPMYGPDDFELGTREQLPKHHLVHEDGMFNKHTGFLSGRFVKSEDVAIDIIKDLANRPDGSLLFSKEKYEHTYPHCWRCKTPLIYIARDSWYIRMSALRDKLVKGNEGIVWEPAHIKEGRFGEWLREIKDWAISRERYWGTPLPVWTCHACQTRRVVGSVNELKKKPKNTYFVMRHGQSENNIGGILNSDPSKQFHLTQLGKEEATKAAQSLKKEGIDFIYTSPFIRTAETAALVQEQLGIAEAHVLADDRLKEFGFGNFEGKTGDELARSFPFEARFERMPDGGETYRSAKKRMGDFLYEMESKYAGKKILIVTHAGPAAMLMAAARGADQKGSLQIEQREYLENGQAAKLDFSILPLNHDYELDLHRPYIDQMKLACSCGGEMVRAREVMDVWLDSGAMPFAQDHYPFNKGTKEPLNNGTITKKNTKTIVQWFLGLIAPSSKQKIAFPADFICEAIDQTRGWFYTLHAVSAIMGRPRAFEHVICLGHVMDAQGKKMSKSLGNVIDPSGIMNKYGADALRFWMYSINQPGDSKNFDEKTVDEIVKKVFNLAANVLSFYKMYEDQAQGTREQLNKGKISTHILDQWIIARLNLLVDTATKGMEAYELLGPTRAIRDFVGDLSQWYLRRSRDRFKGDDLADKEAALMTTRYVLLTLAKVMAPFTPFFAEYLYKEVGGELESVHLESWPTAGKVEAILIKEMESVREISSRGLEARMKAKINVRQPLASLTSKKGAGLSERALELIKDEVNVKNVLFNENLAVDAELDLTITPALKEEGMVRELIRIIQDMRKEKGLNVGDHADLKVETNGEGRKVIDKNQAFISSATSLRSISFTSVEGQATDIGGISFKVAL